MRGKWLPIVLLIAGSACPALAGYGEGVSAFQAGNYDEALQQWLPLAEAGDADAQYNAACMFAKGTGTAQNVALAGKWHRRAAENDRFAARWDWLANHEDHGFSWLLFKEAPSNRFRYSIVLKLTDGNTMIWDCATEDRDSADIFFRVGVMYEKGGMGLPQNYSEAAKWYERAIERGNVHAQTLLAYLYISGKGVERDLNRAGRLFLKAAAEGNARAQGDAGTMFEKGWGGVSIDLPAAYVMYSRAVRQGDTVPPYGPFLADLKARMSQEQLKEAEDMDRQWQENGRPPSRLRPN